MPEVSRFFGIVIRMYWEDHPPPHFHAQYGEHKAQISIQTLEILHGQLPPRVLGLVTEWGALHQDELLDLWKRAARRQTLHPIAPLG